jgi:hypothetical protein
MRRFVPARPVKGRSSRWFAGIGFAYFADWPGGNSFCKLDLIAFDLRKSFTGRSFDEKTIVDGPGCP